MTHGVLVNKSFIALIKLHEQLIPGLLQFRQTMRERHFSKSNLAGINVVDYSEAVVLFTLTHYPLTIDEPGGDLPG